MGQQLDVRRLAASGARARVLEERLEQLCPLVVELHANSIRIRETEEKPVVQVLGVPERALRLEGLELWFVSPADLLARA